MSNKLDSKSKSRVKKLISLIKSEEVPRLRHYLEKYSKKLDLSTLTVSGKDETLLHVASKKCKADSILCLLKKDLCSPLTKDRKGNLPIHLALTSALKMKRDQDFFIAYKDCVLVLLKAEPSVVNEKNVNGISVKELLDAADAREQKIKAKRQAEKDLSENESVEEDEEWRSKLAAEADDEYEGDWGQYENDFRENFSYRETYDDWASRISSEFHNKRRRLNNPNPSKADVEDTKPQWTEEDQRRFEKEEETKKLEKRKAQLQKTKELFDNKYSDLESDDSKEISTDDLPFKLEEKIEDIAALILFDIKVSEEPLKFLKEKQRQWHPDKFSQKFGHRLPEESKDVIVRKVTEISQYLNSYVV